MLSIRSVTIHLYDTHGIIPLANRLWPHIVILTLTMAAAERCPCPWPVEVYEIGSFCILLIDQKFPQKNCAKETRSPDTI